jgi:hypothetical protein
VATKVERAGTDRDWWLRVVLVLQRPSAVFPFLRDDSREAAGLRQEPVLAIIALAGIAGVLSTNVAGSILDDFEIDDVVLAVWVFVAGLIYGTVGYFFLGALLHLGEQLADSLGSYRRARHVLAFAAVPLAASLLVWPVRLAIYGSDSFRSGGADSGAGGAFFEALELVFIGWSLGLLVVGVRLVNGWSWTRAVAACAVPAVVPALALLRAYGVI